MAEPIANSADGLAVSDLPRLFERFWRKDKARTDAEHSGLGVPLAKSYAALLGLDLSATLGPNAELILKLRGAVG